MNIVSVLRSGGSYGPEDVRKLRDGVQRHLSRHHDFWCFTDMADAVREACGGDVLALQTDKDWPGWWHKMTMFEAGEQFGDCFYCDLDSVVLRDLEPMIAWAEQEIKHGASSLIMLRDRRHPDLLGSGIMAWRPGPASRSWYERFAEDPMYFMRKYRQMPALGDQSYLVDCFVKPEEEIATWPEAFHASLNTDNEATCRNATIAVCSWRPKLPEMATEDSWRGEIVRGAWL